MTDRVRPVLRRLPAAGRGERAGRRASQRQAARTYGVPQPRLAEALTIIEASPALADAVLAPMRRARTGPRKGLTTPLAMEVA